MDAVPETRTGAAYTHAAALYARRRSSLDIGDRGSIHEGRSSHGRSSIVDISSVEVPRLQAFQHRSISWRLSPDNWEAGQPLLEEHASFSPAVREFYVKQREMLEAFRAMDAIGAAAMPSSADVLAAENADRQEQFAILISNLANFVLLVAKVYACIQSRSLSIIASTLDSLLDLLSGLILWETDRQIRKDNPYKYPIGKARMQPVGIIIFAVIMACLGLQVLLEAVKQLIEQVRPEHLSHLATEWLVGIMLSVTVVKLALWLWCRSFENEIILAYAQDHFFDVVTNVVGLVAALLASRFSWWIDPVGAIVLAVYTMGNWGNTVLENAAGLVGSTASPESLQRFTYLAFNHHPDILAIDTVRAYTFGSLYFVEVDIQLSPEMCVREAHDIAESLQEKLESLPEVERAFVHIDYEVRHRPEHKR